MIWIKAMPYQWVSQLNKIYSYVGGEHLTYQLSSPISVEYLQSQNPHFAMVIKNQKIILITEFLVVINRTLLVFHFLVIHVYSEIALYR